LNAKQTIVSPALWAGIVADVVPVADPMNDIVTYVIWKRPLVPSKETVKVSPEFKEIELP